MKSPLLDNIFSEDLYFKNDPTRASCLTMAIRDARLISNRDMTTGEVTLSILAPLFPNKWPAALLYLILLEQIGTCFKNKNIQAVDGNPIYKALKNFTTLGDNECRAIEALRHSFAHSYSLCNVKLDNKNKIVQDRTHIYTLVADETTPLIALPTTPWQATFSSKSQGQGTKINIWKLGDFVEETFKTVKKEYHSDNIELILKDGETELKTRFTTTVG
jgi:hypothetical protein